MHLTIADFGCAFVDREGYGTAAVQGTMAYMAPEVLLRGPIGCPADIWSCGLILAEMAIGRPLLLAPTLPGMINLALRSWGTLTEGFLKQAAPWGRWEPNFEIDSPELRLNIHEVLSSLGGLGGDIFLRMCHRNPLNRPEAFQVRMDPFFSPATLLIPDACPTGPALGSAAAESSTPAEDSKEEKEFLAELGFPSVRQPNVCTEVLRENHIFVRLVHLLLQPGWIMSSRRSHADRRCLAMWHRKHWCIILCVP